MRGRGLRVAARKQPMSQDTSAHQALCGQLRVCGYGDFQVEYRFATSIDRQWEWDIAWPERLIAVEVDGGIWVAGAHGHPTTIMRNMEKRNWAARLGWRVLSFDTTQAKNGEALRFIEAVLGDHRQLTQGENYAAIGKRSSRRWDAAEVRKTAAGKGL